MTGGQMAPTTLEGQKTATTPYGRSRATTGDPLNVIDMMKTLDVAYLARGSVTNSANIMKVKKYIRKAFEIQQNKGGYSFVEVLSPCPTNWGMEPLKALLHIDSTVTGIYPLGEFVDKSGGGK
jgi:2-oxoglutarate ferredoxin oxidoreductase subunit beta